MIQIQSVLLLIIHQKTAAACVVDPTTQTGNYNRNFTAFLQTHRHRNDKPPFSTSAPPVVSLFYVSVKKKKKLYRAVLHLKKGKTNQTHGGLGGDSEGDILLNHR